jgi:HNH endonuclease
MRSSVPINSHPSLAGSLWIGRALGGKELPAMTRFILKLSEAKKHLARYCQGSGNYLAEFPEYDGTIEKIGIEVGPPYRFYLDVSAPPEPRYEKRKMSAGLRWRVYERDGFKCVKCGVQKNLTVDHIIPEAKGGQAVLENLQTLCKSHNSSKGTKE